MRARSLLMALMLAVTVAAAGAAGRSQAVEQPVALERNGTRATGMLRLPGSNSRPPVVLLVTDADAASLGAALAGERVASLRLDARTTDPDVLAQWISFLRNDERFPLVTVFAEGAALAPGVVAARAARADGLVTRGDTTPAATELARVVAAVKEADAKSDTDLAKQIATLARSVAALGRRGTSPARLSGRRSLRHTVMASVGHVRVSIEWGQPEMRGRTIWGELVEWGRTWMPGADEATTLTTDGPLVIGSMGGSIEVPAGDHTLYTLPASDRVQLLISRDVGQFHTVYDASLVIGRTDMSLQTRPDHTEGLTFAIRPAADGRSATMTLTWDQREYAVTLTAR